MTKVPSSHHLQSSGLHVSLLVMLFIAYSDVASATKELFADQTQDDISNALKRIQDLHKTREGLTSLRNVLHDIDSDLLSDQARLCLLWGDYSDACAFGKTGNDDTNTRFGDWMARNRESNPSAIGSYDDSRGSQLLEEDSVPVVHKTQQSGFLGKLLNSVQKRSGSFQGSPTPGSDVTRKRQGLLILKRILDEMDNDIIVEQKRMCRFNLGGHCATESAAAVADQWHYLNSHLSPGRKRRDATRLLNKAMNAQVLKDDKSA